MGASVPDSVASEIYTVRDLVDAVHRPLRRSQLNVLLRVGQDVINEATRRDAERATIDDDHPITAPIYFLGLRLIHLMLRDLFKLQVEGSRQAAASQVRSSSRRTTRASSMVLW